MFTEDLVPFFADFGQTATVAGQAVQVIFDNAYTASGVGVGMAGTQPVITVRTADLPADPYGAAVLVSGKSYLVGLHEPDGSGLSRCFLESVA